MKKVLRFLLGKYYKRFNSHYWQFVSVIYPFFFQKRGTLIYAGLNVGDSFQKIFFKYKRVIGFEPNIENYNKVSYYNQFKGVEIFNFALSDKKGKVKFYLPDNMNNDASASLSRFSESNSYQSRKSIEVKTINLCDFLIEKSIKKIDFYISDIEGYDHKVLLTIFDKYIEPGKVKVIQVEAVNDLVDNPYLDCSNYEHDFDNLLLNQYKKIGRGSGFVKPGDNFAGNTLDVLYTLI